MSLKIVFAGTPEFSIPPLEALLGSKHTVVAVYTQPDRPAGRGRTLHASPVKALALEHNIPVYQPERLRDQNQQEILRDLDADLMVVVAYGLILPRAILEIPRLGCINIHASLLPRWRGAAPIQHAILAGDKTTGICTMQMDAGLDTGDILLTAICPIEAEETEETLHDKLSVLGSRTLMETLEKLELGTLHPQKQEAEGVTYAHKILKEHSKINWNETAIELDRKIRAFNPWPVASSSLNNEVVRIWAAKPLFLETPPHTKPGTIIHTSHEGIDVATGNGVLRLLELQFPGRKRLPVKDILQGAKTALWTKLV